MRFSLLFASVLTCLCYHVSLGQVTITISTLPVIAEKGRETDLVVPIPFELENTSSTPHTVVISMVLNGTPPADSEPRGDNRTVTIPANRNLPTALYVFIPKIPLISTTVIIPFTITISGGTISPISVSSQLSIIRGHDIIYTLSDYLNNEDLKLDAVGKVESSNNILTVSGTIDGRQARRNIALSPGEVLAVSEGSWFLRASHYNPVPLSLMTVPFKVRRKTTTASGTEIQRIASAGLTNIGFNFELTDWQMDRYFSNGKKSTHRFSMGWWAAPTVEELDATLTDGYLTGQTKSKQLFISTGLTISYAYNDIAFVIVPAGWDIATSAIGHESIYNKKRWWGFGIAVSPKIFATILNK